MRKLIIPIMVLTCLCMVSSCTTPQKTLYTWGDYQNESYDYMKNGTDKSLDDLLKAYEEIVNNQKGTRQTVPPGVCADYGYFLVMKGQKEKGLAMMKQEIALYPESAVFMTRIINKLEK